MNKTMLAYGPGLTSKYLKELAVLAYQDRHTCLYLQELDVERLPSELRSGMLASLPFSGLMKEQMLFLRTRAQELGCKSFTFGLPGGWVRDERISEMDDLLKSMASGANLRLVPTFVMAQVEKPQLELAIDICFDNGLDSICFGTGTSLDTVTTEYLDTAVNRYLAKSKRLEYMEVACEILDAKALYTQRICFSRTKAETHTSY